MKYLAPAEELCVRTPLIKLCLMQICLQWSKWLGPKGTLNIFIECNPMAGPLGFHQSAAMDWNFWTSSWFKVESILLLLVIVLFIFIHSLIRGILTQSCSARAKNFTKCVFYHVQFSGVIQNIAYHRAIFTLFVYVDCYQNNQFYVIKISFSKFCFYGTMTGNILDNTTELYIRRSNFV